jgi:hypothetical protein
VYTNFSAGVLGGQVSGKQAVAIAREGRPVPKAFNLESARFLLRSALATDEVMGRPSLFFSPTFANRAGTTFF